MSNAAGGLSQALLGWMAQNRPRLDELMTQEGSRSVHQEFLLAEGGALPTRAERLARARDASGRAWLRYLAAAFGQVGQRSSSYLGGRIEAALLGRAERLEAIQIEEAGALERRGRGGDPEADRRLLELAAQRRMFAEALGEAIDDPEPPALGRRIAGWGWQHAARLRDLSAEAPHRVGNREPDRARAGGDRDPLGAVAGRRALGRGRDDVGQHAISGRGARARASVVPEARPEIEAAVGPASGGASG